jgi:hypothetical protein
MYTQKMWNYTTIMFENMLILKGWKLIAFQLMHIYFTKVFGKIKFEIGRNVIGVTKVEGFYLRKEFSKCFGD